MVDKNVVGIYKIGKDEITVTGKKALNVLNYLKTDHPSYFITHREDTYDSLNDIIELQEQIQKIMRDEILDFISHYGLRLFSKISGKSATTLIDLRKADNKIRIETIKDLYKTMKKEKEKLAKK